MDKIITSPLKAVRLHCLDCCNGSPLEVKECPVIKCMLHPFRFGKNPYRKKRELTEEELNAKRELAEKARLSKNSLRN